MLEEAAFNRIVEAARDLARRPPNPGRLPTWNEAETALAATICIFGDPSRLGGTRTAKDGTTMQHPAVVALSRAVRRTPDAVVLKVMNLRKQFTGGSRGMAHVSNIDRWAAATFGARVDELVWAAELVAALVPSAREVLDAFSPRPLVENGVAVPAPPSLSEIVPPSTTVLRERAERRGQSLFRARVLANFSYACAFCGLRSRLPDRNSFLLQASHIRPWKESDDCQRLDVKNGFALCAIHDRAFDWGFVTVDESFRIVASPHAREHYEPEALVQSEIAGLNGQGILHPDKHFTWPGGDYLRYHREQVFERRFLG